ncbi:MAG: aspartyl protease family protein [Kiritimatiellae bacterium]|nr:aspartyl protease family protein [Kiritimatiellia bacterium]
MTFHSTLGPELAGAKSAPRCDLRLYRHASFLRSVSAVLVLTSSSCWLTCAAEPIRPPIQWAEIPVEIVGRVVFVSATINGQGPFTLILDTGATETIITPRTAERLGLRAVGPGGGQKSAWVDSLVVGNAVVGRLPVIVFDPPQALPLRIDKGMNYHGLLGYTFLSRFVTRVDFGTRRVRFEPLAGSPPIPEQSDAKERHRIHLELRDRLLHVQAKVNGGGPLMLVVDTGSAETVLSTIAARRVGLVTVPLSGYANVQFCPGAAIGVGTATVEKVPLIVMDAGGIAMAPGADGILGYTFLSEFVVTINYRDRVLTLER